jgi:hypothetical protein
MIEEVEPSPDSQLPESPLSRRACEHCGNTALTTRTTLSIYTGKTVRMFECSSGHRTWSDE